MTNRKAVILNKSTTMTRTRFARLFAILILISILSFLSNRICAGLSSLQRSETYSAPSWVKQPLTREEMYNDIAGFLPKHPLVAEVGVWRGDNAKSIFLAFQPRLLILQDSWDETTDPRYKEDNERLVRSKFAKEIASGTVSIKKGPSKSTITTLPPGKVDFLYLDTTHSYKMTYNELVIATAAVAPEGFLCGHDFVHRPSYGVIPAAVEFALTYNWSFTHVTETQDSSRSFCLQRRPSKPIT